MGIRKRMKWLCWIVIGSVSYMHRFFILPRNRLHNWYLHKYLGPDNRSYGLHTHPWPSMSIRLWGAPIYEYRFKKGRHGVYCEDDSGYDLVKLPRVVFRKASDAHAICKVQVPVYTLFITGPVCDKWGFYTRHGWQHWRKVVPNSSGV